MNSPDSIPFNSFIQIDRSSHTAVFLQIATQLINAIQRGYLPKGVKLPGTRSLAQLIDVHRNTMVAVYNELEAQGWIEVKPNKGAFVINKSDNKPVKFKNYEQQNLVHYPTHTGFHFIKNNILDEPIKNIETKLSLNDGLPDIRLAQVEKLAHLYTATLKRKNNQKKLFNNSTENSLFFKQQLSNFLNLSRSLHSSKKNLLVTNSIEMSLFIAVNILINKNDVVVVGNPSFYTTNMTFLNAGAQIKQINVDSQGIVVDDLEKLCKTTQIRLLYITPHHHYPTTVTLSADRRIQLLNLSAKYGFIILEDDYDYDFHYNSSPILPLASADNHGMVVYIGSFGKTLAPGFRKGFIVAPENLIQEMEKYLRIIDNQPDIIMEEVLGDMIAEGEIHRHLKKVIKIYQQRRDNFQNLLNTHLSPNILFQAPNGGLAFWTKWDNHLNLNKIANKCAKNNLYIPKVLLYQSNQISAIRMGFGHLNFDEQNSVVQIIKQALD